MTQINQEQRRTRFPPRFGQNCAICLGNLLTQNHRIAKLSCRSFCFSGLKIRANFAAQYA